MKKMAWVLFGLCSCITAALSTYSYFSVRMNRANWSLAPNEIAGFLRPVGTHELEFRISNHSDHTIEIVGLETACKEACCFSWSQRDRILVMPRESVLLNCHLSLKVIGPFESTVSVFVNDGGLSERRITVSGAGLPPEDADAAFSKGSQAN